MSFAQFVAIDWSGAAGERHAGIAVAMANAGRAAPVLIRPAHRWSRPEVLDWLMHDLPEDTMVGIDLGISLPFQDHGAFFPDLRQSPADARALWALVETTCGAEPHLGVSRFVDDAAFAPYFRRHGGREGALFGGGIGRLRQTERAQARMGCRPCSNFNLVGAAQVGKSSLSGMRLLHRLGGVLPVWPIDPRPRVGSLICEIYTSLAALEAGRRAGRAKMRTHADLSAALLTLGSAAVRGDGPISDHAADALLSAAWLRCASAREAPWHPAALAEVAQTEGWTFGAV